MSEINTGTALHKNSNVIDFTAILEANNRHEAAQDFRELVEQVSRMERQLDRAAREILAMRRDLAELRDFHGEPLHNTARQGIDAAARQIGQAKERLGAVKDWIVQGAKDAADAVREKGVAALDRAVSFLGIRKELEKIQSDSVDGVNRCDRSIARVENVSRQYHEVGTAARNLGRAILGRAAQDDRKQMGKLAKLTAAPHKALKNLYSGMGKSAGATLGKVEKLEQAAKRPSMLENLQAMKETAAKEQGMALSPEKTKKEPSL